MGFLLFFFIKNGKIVLVINLTIEEILKKSIQKLKQAKIEDAILKSKIIVSNVLDKPKEYLLINGEKEIECEQIDRVNKNIDKLIKGVPIQYITNSQEFMGFSFYVDENVLIPQPDTEILVEETISIAKKIENPKVLDLCTGSGAIAISIAKNINIRKLLATDISKDALNVTKINCKKNDVENIELIESDLFENIHENFNIIVSNPPYIETKVIETLSTEVKCEPRLALDGGKDGLDFYKTIIEEGYIYLEPEGYLCLEIGYDQKDKVIKLIENNGNYKNIYSKKDLENNDRVIVCQKL